MGVHFLAPPDIIWRSWVRLISAKLKQDKLFVKSGVEPDLLTCYGTEPHQKLAKGHMRSTSLVELPPSLV